jgi:ATP-dependent helicase/nuclease subunit A
MSAWENIMTGMAAEQKAAATARGNSVVSAGAGSGKTRVLAVRYLYLVKELGIHPSRIACLTFTNKASAEMQERIRGMLEDCATDDPVFEEALTAFPQSCVTTLDALCSEIARNASARWGIPPDFSIDQQGARDETRSVALEYLLNHRTSAVPARFIAANGFEGAVEALCALASSRDGLMGPAELAFDPEIQTRKLKLALEALDADIASIMEGGRGLDSGTAKGSKSWVEMAEAWPDESPDLDDPDTLTGTTLGAAAERYRFLLGLRKPTGTNPAACYFNPVCDELRQKTTTALFACQALLDPDRGEALAFARDFILLAREKRIASGTLQFQDVAAMAKEALLYDGALRNWYKARFDAVMVDEFQDDNELQKDILYLLAEKRDRLSLDDGSLPGPGDLEPGVLFFVGDEKQSIYLFRNADVKVFRGLADELSAVSTPTTLGSIRSGPEGKPACLNLSTNWRSEPYLIDFFNQTFSRLMPAPDNQVARDYEARFAGLLAGPATPGVQACVSWMEAAEPRKEAGPQDEAGPGTESGLSRAAGPGTESGLSQAAGPGTESGLSALETQAWRVAELIRELVDTKVPVTAKGSSGKEARPCEYEDIAILFRASAAQNTYERYLRIFGIPYTATATAGLYVESILGDLYAILRLVAYPDDRLALAAVLRGPLAQLSDDACFVVLERARDEGCSLGDPRLLAGLTEGDSIKATVLLETWTWLRGAADRLSLAELVSTLWYERGLRWNVLRNPDNTAYLEHFDFAWSLAADADARGLRLCDFIATLEPLIGEVKKVEDVSVVRESARGVSVMTVHASKGLEFPVVILPGAENTGRGDRQEAIVLNERLGPSIRLMDDQGQNTDPVYQMEKTMDAMERTIGDTVMDEDLAETIRLFYVACTRAVSRLYICSKLPHTEDRKGKSFRSLFLRAWPHVQALVEGAAETGNKVPQWLAIEPISGRTVADYARLVNTGSMKADGALAAARFLAMAAAPALPTRKARWAVTAAAEILAAPMAGTPGSSTQESLPREVDSSGDQAALEGFGEDCFGTLCHELTEGLIGFPGIDPEPSPGTTRKLSRLSAATRAAILAEAYRLAQAFACSPRGLAAAAARDALRAGQRGAVFGLEYGFTWRGQSEGRPVFLSGSMDLVYGDSQGVWVVDFKTDRQLRPERHAFQLGIYRESAQSIFGVPARAILYYLRTGEEHEIDLHPDVSTLHFRDRHAAESGGFSAGQVSYV